MCLFNRPLINWRFVDYWTPHSSIHADVAHCSTKVACVLVTSLFLRRGRIENAVDNDNVLRIESSLRCPCIWCCDNVVMMYFSNGTKQHSRRTVTWYLRINNTRQNSCEAEATVGRRGSIYVTYSSFFGMRLLLLSWVVINNWWVVISIINVIKN